MVPVRGHPEALSTETSSPSTTSAHVLGRLFTTLILLSTVMILCTDFSAHVHNRSLQGEGAIKWKEGEENLVLTQKELHRWLLLDLLHGEKIGKNIWGSPAGGMTYNGQRLVVAEGGQNISRLLAGKGGVAEGGDEERMEEGEATDAVHEYSYGVSDANNSAVKEIEEADRLVTEPDDVEIAAEEWKAANETARAEAEGHVTAIVLRRPYAQPGTEIAYAGVTGRGDFAWVERSPDGTEAGAVSTDPVADGTLSGSNASNLTGVWVWCKNASDIAKVSWQNGTLHGVGRLRRNETLLSIRAKCVVVDGPGFDKSGRAEEEDEEEEEEAQAAERHWDEPFMTYEPHPSSVGWDKKHWRKADWIIWVCSGPVVTLLFSISIFWLFGPLWGMAALAALVSADALTYYWNW